MTDAIEVDADLTASHDGHEIRIHGRSNALAVDADSWSPLLKLRKLRPGPVSGVLSQAIPDRGSLKVSVRGSMVCSIRCEEGTLRRRFHPVGIIRSLFASR